MDGKPKGTPMDKIPDTATDNTVHVCAIHGMCMDHIHKELKEIKDSLRTMYKYMIGFMISIILMGFGAILTKLLKG